MIFNEADDRKLLSRDFIALNAMIFLAYTNLAAFFTFDGYLHQADACHKAHPETP